MTGNHEEKENQTEIVKNTKNGAIKTKEINEDTGNLQNVNEIKRNAMNIKDNVERKQETQEQDKWMESQCTKEEMPGRWRIYRI